MKQNCFMKNIFYTNIAVKWTPKFPPISVYYLELPVSNAVASLNKLYSKQNLMKMVKTFHEIFNGIINTIVEEQWNAVWEYKWRVGRFLPFNGVWMHVHLNQFKEVNVFQRSNLCFLLGLFIGSPIKRP